MRNLALALALLIGSGLIAAQLTPVFAAEDAAKKCEAEKDAKKKEECMQKAKGN